VGSRKTGTPAGGRTTSAKARTRWRELNDRQRAYLEAVYRADQDEEAWQRSAWSRGGRAAPTDEWRWILYGSTVFNETPLRIALKEKNLVDPGSGSTFAALAERGLLLTRHGTLPVPLGGGRVGYWGTSRSSTRG